MTKKDIDDIISIICPNDEDFEKTCISPAYLKKELEVLALEQEPCEGTISRQAAIDATWEEPMYADPINVLTEIRDRLNVLSTIEFVRCRECKHRDPEDKKCDCGHGIVWQLVRDDNWFCADGKRRSENDED